MKVLHLVILEAVVLVSGDIFDTLTTAIALLNPAFSGQFVEVGDPFIKLFMYNLGMGASGFYFAILISFCIDFLFVYVAFSKSRSYYASGLSGILVVMFLWGAFHWVAGYQNLMLLYSVAPFGW
jgi:hypothetical protein